MQRSAPAFADTALKSFVAPSGLRAIKTCVFLDCKNLKEVRLNEGLTHAELSGGLECIGEKCFHESGVEEVTLLATLRKVGSGAFEGCDRLAVVWVEEGCAVNIRKLAGRRVQVRRK